MSPLLPARTPIEGTDLSVYQRGKVDLEEAKAAGVRFVIARAGQGTDYVDPTFNSWISQASDLYIGRTAYFFLNWRGSQRKKIREQADNLIRSIDELFAHTGCELTMPPFVDCELQKYKTTAAQWADLGENFALFPAAAVVDAMLTFCERVDSGLGCTTGIYTQRSFWQYRMHCSTQFDGRPLWLAGQSKGSLRSWKPVIYQYDVARRPWASGCKVDLDRAPGALPAWRKA